MSTGLQDVGLKIGDYQAVPDKTLYNNIGPQCANCRKPYRQCECPAQVEVPGEFRPGNPSQRQAEALEIIAVQLGKIVKHLERAEAAAPVPFVDESLLRPAAVILPGVTAEGVPVLDEATLAKNEAKKAETLAKLGAKK